MAVACMLEKVGDQVVPVEIRSPRRMPPICCRHAVSRVAASAAAGGGGGTLIQEMPEFMLTFLVFLLAHHPDYPTQEVGGWALWVGGMRVVGSWATGELVCFAGSSAHGSSLPDSCSQQGSQSLHHHALALPASLHQPTQPCPSSSPHPPLPCSCSRSIAKQMRRSARRCLAGAAPLRPSRPCCSLR